MNILVSWIGHTDLKNLLNGDFYDEVRSLTRPPYDHPADGGPIKTLLNQKSFDAIYLLSDYSESITEAYLEWLNIKTSVSYTKLQNPTNYGEIYTVANDFLEQLSNKLPKGKNRLSFLLSPGTPAMSAIWILLGKTKYPATFWQTWNGKVTETEIPFDITLDVVPELLSSSDNVFHHLATKSPGEVKGFESIIGNSKAIRLAVGRAQKAAIRDVSILLTGESGTGKELFAKAIHEASPRRNKPFIAINCAAIPKDLLESELFGHAKGAFTGADKKKDGAFKQADGGIIFLDEVGECASEIQAKLLRVLQPPHNQSQCLREFSPVGSTEIETANVRIISATNRNLGKMVEDGLFREDLFFRLALITVPLPPLRSRKSDILPIAEHLLKKINTEFSEQDKSYKHKIFSDCTNTFIKKCIWSGNIRELNNVILQSVVMSDKETITPEDIQASLLYTPSFSNKDKELIDAPLGDGFNLEEHLNAIQKHYLRRAMEEAGGIKTKAASLLGLKSYQAMDAQIKRLNVDLDGI